VLLIDLLGWRTAWLVAAGVLTLALAPLITGLLAGNRTAQPIDHATLRAGLGGRQWQRADAVRHWLLPALIPALLTPGFIGKVRANTVARSCKKTVFFLNGILILWTSAF